MAAAQQPLQRVTERRTAPVELLWDLVFVFAVTQVTALLSHELSWDGVGQGALVLALIWWAWSAFVWAANATDPSSTSFRAALVLALVSIFTTGLAIPHAFSDDATLFTVSYAIVRFIHLGLYVQASRQGNAAWSAIVGFAAATTAGMVLLVVGSLIAGELRTILWLVAIALDYAGPAWLTRERLAGLQAVAVAHFAERYGLFIIICLGESIVAIGLGASGHELDFGLVASISLSLMIVVALWWTYFDRVAEDAEAHLRRHDNPVLAAADAYSYIHLLLVAGIVFFAFGAEWAIAGIDSPLDPVARMGLFGGVALYLLGHAAFRLRMTGGADILELAAAVVIGVEWAVLQSSDAWVCLVALFVVLAALTFEQSREVASRP
jgi:low temperature requirement protein LtrA